MFPPHVPLPASLDFNNPQSILRDADFPTVPAFDRPTPSSDELVQHLANGVFVALNHRENFSFESPDWKLGPLEQHRLWAVTLHYHTWCYDLALAVRDDSNHAQLAEKLLVHYVTDWIDRCDINQPGARDLAWNAFAIATRMSWWIRAYHVLDDDWWNAHADFRTRFLRSLWRQAEYLSDHIEWDLRANHLMRDAVGLAWAGRFFTGKNADGWMQQAVAIATDQVQEQILADGCHFERSPMYHLQIMEDVLSLALLLDDPAAAEQCRDTWVQMADALSWMRHPDGDIPLFNDAARDAVTDPKRMLELGRRIGVDAPRIAPTGGRHFADMGMLVWHGRPWTVFFDVGQVGPDCQPGHAHADTLTFECSVNGRRLFVDPGTHSYDRDATRRYDRSTDSHNTVCIDETNSSEIWHIFRLGHRATPNVIRADLTGHSMTAEASHDGYRRLPMPQTHTRRVHVENDGPLEIVDRVDGGGRHRVSGGLLLAPEWTAKSCPSGWEVSCDGQVVRVTVKSTDDIQLSMQQRVVHPEFGLELTTTRLTWSFEGETPLEVIVSVRADSSASRSSQPG